MKRMWSRNELRNIIRALVQSGEDFTFGGDVSISGDLSVTGSINGEENPSVKPIYCHPINFEPKPGYPGTNNIRPMLFIFNNDATKITTIAQLKAIIESWGLNYAYILLTGGSKINDKVLINRGLYVAKTGDTFQYYLTGTYADGSYSGGIDISSELNDDYYSIDDGVNKIN